MKKFLFIGIFVFGASMLASAQVEFTLQGTMTSPLGDFKKIFKAGTGASLTISKTNTYKKKRTTVGGSIGYTSFAPKGILYYTVRSANDGSSQNAYIKYDNMQSYELAAQFRRDFIVAEKIEFFYGLELGLYYTKSGYEQNDPNHNVDSGNFSARAAVAPKAGISFQFTKNVGVFVQTKYLLCIGKMDITDKLVTTFSANSAGVNFRF